MNQIGKYPNTFFRVSVKAIIRDDNDKVLVVKEYDSDSWSLPGGGLDHGETFEECLLRELNEEVGYKGGIDDANIIGTHSMYLESKDACLLWLVCEVKLSNNKFCVGEYCNSIEFVDPRTLINSTSRSEKLVYKFCVDKNIKV